MVETTFCVPTPVIIPGVVLGDSSPKTYDKGKIILM